MAEPREADHALLEQFRTQRKDAEAEWEKPRNEAKIDKLCVAGKPWQALDPAAMKERKDAKRPYLALDELGQYINQTVNDIRANPRGIKYAPTGNGANDAGAEFYQNHTREIEYRSDASMVYARAFEDCVTSSYGWLKIAARRQHVRTFDKDLWLEPIVNADQILPDPMAIWPDSRDMKYLLHLEPWLATEYDRRYGKSKAAKQDRALSMKAAPGWLTARQTFVAEAWQLEAFDRKLVAFQPAGLPGQPKPEPQMVLLDELPGGKLPDGVDNVREETVEDTRVRCYVTNGLEILERTEWKGKYIPYVSCMGKILYVDEGAGPERQILSMTRLARDPYMLYCYIRTCQAEAIGGVPRATWVGYEGQFAKPDNWKRANSKPVWALEAKAYTQGVPPGGAPLPLPTKVPWDPPLQNLEIAAEAARRAIQASMGITPLPTPMQQDNQQLSGTGMDRLDSSSQRGSFHFKDSYGLMIRRTGVILEDLMSPTLDTARNVPVRKPDDSAMIVRINDARGQGPDGKPQDPIFTKGDYRVTVSEGPATESQRVEANEFVSALVGRLGDIAQLAGPQTALQLFAKAIKLKQLGPIGDEIIDLLDPKQLGQDGKPLPPEVAKLLAENKQLKGILQQAAQEKQGKVVEQEGKYKIVQLQEAAETQRSRESNETKMAVAELSARVERLALLIMESHEAGTRHASNVAHLVDTAHDAAQREKDRAHERITQLVEHSAGMQAAAQAADLDGQAAEQSAALERGNASHAASLEPVEPDAGAV